jgi:predicted protein tyrosine phosphatase
VPEDYIEFAYNTAQENMHQYAREIKPDNLYIVLNIEGKYKFMKYENGKILKKKNDKYVPVH